MKKKGALELSVTAIVILILAIVILGLGLGFIRGMFGKVSVQFEEQIAAEPEPRQPSRSEPLTISREAIVTNAGETEVLKIGIYNAWGGNATTFVKPYLTCSDTNLKSAINTSQQVINKSISAGSSDTFNYIFTTGNAPEGLYLCQAVLGPVTVNNITYAKDITLRITK